MVLSRAEYSSYFEAATRSATTGIEYGLKGSIVPASSLYNSALCMPSFEAAVESMRLDESLFPI